MADVVRIESHSGFVEGGQEFRRDGMVLRTELEGTATYRAGEGRDLSSWQGPTPTRPEHPLVSITFLACGVIIAGTGFWWAEIEAAMRATSGSVKLAVAVPLFVAVLYAAWRRW